MSEIKISIVIPVYNNEKYIIPAVESVISQQCKGIEIIIVDDGSTDNTVQIVDDLADKYQEIKVVHQDNQWIYASFNNGIKVAKGDYIYILNSDDKLNEGSLEKMLNIIEEYHPDVIWTKVVLCECDIHQNIYRTVDMNKDVIEFQYVDDVRENPEKVLIPFIKRLAMNQCNLYRRELMVMTPFRNDYYGGDYIFNLEASKHITSYVILPEEVYDFYIYNEGKGNTSIGRYYGYEHSMFNEFYTRGMELLEALNIRNERNEKYFVKRRKRDFSAELSLLLNNCVDKNLDEKIYIILNEFIDETILSCFKADMEELDSRILSCLRMWFLNNKPDDKGLSMDAYNFLIALLRYEKNESDFNGMKQFVYDTRNPNRIGECFYLKLIQKP